MDRLKLVSQDQLQRACLRRGSTIRGDFIVSATPCWSLDTMLSMSLLKLGLHELHFASLKPARQSTALAGLSSDLLLGWRIARYRAQRLSEFMWPP
jgi:hypothetical protein